MILGMNLQNCATKNTEYSDDRFVQNRQNAYVAIVHCYKVYFKTL